jgi:hypothetical protein
VLCCCGGVESTDRLVCSHAEHGDAVVSGQSGGRQVYDKMRAMPEIRNAASA